MKTFVTRWMAVVVVGCAASLALADGGKIDGMLTSNIQIKTVKDGKLVFVHGGRDRTEDLNKVELLTLDGQPTFGDAEEALAAKDYKKAADLFTQAIAKINNKEQQLVAAARSIKAYDQDGRWTDAVKRFLDVYTASPTAGTFELRPTKMPAANSTMLGESASQIESRLSMGAIKSPQGKKLLQGFLLEVYTKARDPRAAALAKELGGTTPEVKPATPDQNPAPTPMPVAVDSASVKDVDAAIAAKRYDDAVRIADNGLRTATGETAAALFLSKAKALQAAGKADEAAATYLRIPTHYPNSPLAPAALLRAADIQKQQKREDAAKRLYKEVVDKYPNSPEATRAKPLAS